MANTSKRKQHTQTYPGAARAHSAALADTYTHALMWTCRTERRRIVEKKDRRTERKNKSPTWNSTTVLRVVVCAHNFSLVLCHVSTGGESVCVRARFHAERIGIDAYLCRVSCGKGEPSILVSIKMRFGHVRSLFIAHRTMARFTASRQGRKQATLPQYLLNKKMFVVRRGMRKKCTRNAYARNRSRPSSRFAFHRWTVETTFLHRLMRMHFSLFFSLVEIRIFPNWSIAYYSMQLIWKFLLHTRQPFSNESNGLAAVGKSQHYFREEFAVFTLLPISVELIRVQWRSACPKC